MSLLKTILVKIGADASQFDAQLAKTKRQLAAFGSDLSGLGKQLTVGISLPLGAVGLAAIKTAGELEQTSIAFKTMMGSSDAAQKHLEQLKQFALTTPFQFNDLTLASKRLQALGFDANRVIPILTSVGNAASALGMGAEGIQRITTALGQMQAKGKVQAEEMRQLAEAGIPAWQILAKTLNTTVADAMAKVEKRTVDAATAIPALLAGMNAKFGGLMAAQSKTLLGQFSNMKDAITFTLADIGKALMPVAKDVMNNFLQPMLDKLKDLAKGFSDLTPAVRNTTAAMTALVLVGPPLLAAIGYTIAGIGTLSGALSRLVPLLTARVLPVLTALAGPAGIAVAVGAGIAYAGSKMLDFSKQTDTSTASLRKWTAEYYKSRGINTTATASGLPVFADSTLAGVRATFDGVKTGATGATDAIEAAAKAAQALARAYSTLGVEANKARDVMAAVATVARAEGIKGMTTAYEALATLFQRGKITADQFTVALHTVGAALDADHEAAEKLRKVPLETFYKANTSALSELNVEMDFYSGLIEDQISLMGQMKLPPWLTQGSAENLGVGPAMQAEIEAANERIKKSTKDTANSTAAEMKRSAKIAGDTWAQTGVRIHDAIKFGLSDALTAAIFDVTKLGDAFKRMGERILSTILDKIIAQGLNALVDKLASVGGILGKLGGWLGGTGSSSVGSVITGGGGVLGTSVGAAGGAASTIGSASSSAGGAASGALSGVMGMIGIGAGIASAVSGVIGNFQMAGMNKSLDLIEKATRYTEYYALRLIEEAMIHWPVIDSIRDYVWGPGHTGMAELIASVQAQRNNTNVIINLTGGTDPKSTAQEIVRLLKLQGVQVG